MTDFLVKHFVKNYTDTEDIKVRENYGTMAGITGIVCNIFLFVLKFAVGTLSGSISVLSDAFNNLSDSASCVVTLSAAKWLQSRRIRITRSVTAERNISLPLS